MKKLFERFLNWLAPDDPEPIELPEADKRWLTYIWQGGDRTTVIGDWE